MKKPLYLTEAESRWLLDRLGDDPHKLRPIVKVLLRSFHDELEKLKEVTARANASSHFDNVHEPVVRVPKPKKPNAREQLAKLLRDLPADQKAEILRQADEGGRDQ